MWSRKPPIQPITDRFRHWTHPLPKIRRSLIYLPLRHLLTFLPFITIVLILLYYLSLNEFQLPVFLYSSITPLQPLPSIKDDPHPIIPLMHTAATEFEALSNEESHDLASAAWTYRQKRGRHPPPGFDKWFAYAQSHNSLIIEEFWDQIYNDLTPLWALDPKEMRKDVRSQSEVIRVRKGKVTTSSDHFRPRIWSGMVKDILKGGELPDMDIAINIMDEPRLIIEWDTMKAYVEKERAERKIVPVGQVIEKFSRTPEEETDTVPYESFDWIASGWPVFSRVAMACPPNSLARTSPEQNDFSQPPNLTTQYMLPHTHHGYVSNYTLSTSICHQPHLQGLHGAFIEPVSVKWSGHLFPIFGGSKLAENSEILLPAVMYYKPDPRFTTSVRQPWERKTDTLMWRGVASGGRNKVNNWKGFHRHRMVSMLNGTQALLLPDNSGFIDIASLPLEAYNLSTLSASKSVPANVALGTWLESFSDVAFTEMHCWPLDKTGICSYSSYLFSNAKTITLSKYHKHKYLIDVDGNSFSGRYRDFLLSGSVPIKATLFQEWHDSRFIAWKHFAPIDNTYLDIYGVLEFFLGGWDGVGKGREGGRDGLARRIAEQGKEWAEKVIRKEDMMVYVYRLLLEYARVVDDERERLGWVGDLRS